jgi:hypothetical protein
MPGMRQIAAYLAETRNSRGERTLDITEVAVARRDCLDKCDADTFIVGQARNQQ